jgi:hypothetical protein
LQLEGPITNGRRERQMPQIIVTAGPTDPQGRPTVTLRERVNPADFESERFAANLVERLGWAVLDAIQEEQQDPDGEWPEEVVDPEPAPAPARKPAPEPAAAV